MCQARLSANRSRWAALVHVPLRLPEPFLLRPFSAARHGVPAAGLRLVAARLVCAARAARSCEIVSGFGISIYRAFAGHFVFQILTKEIINIGCATSVTKYRVTVWFASCSDCLVWLGVAWCRVPNVLVRRHFNQPVFQCGKKQLVAQ